MNVFHGHLISKEKIKHIALPMAKPINVIVCVPFLHC